MLNEQLKHSSENGRYRFDSIYLNDVSNYSAFKGIFQICVKINIPRYQYCSICTCVE